MAEPNTSFIPKQTMGAGTNAVPVRRRHRFNLFGFVAIVLFVGSLILAGAAFGYQKLNEKVLTDAKLELAEKRNSLNPDDIVYVQALDSQLGLAEQLLELHVSPSKLLDLLERVTQEKIQYTDFKFTRRPSGNVGVEMAGVAPSFNTVALQAERFGDEELLSSVIFSDLNKAEDEVLFKVTLEIEREAIAYDVASAIVPDTATSSDDGITEDMGTTTESVDTTE